MARIHGKSGRVYMGLASSAATAEPVAFQNKWSINEGTDKAEVTAFGDGNKVYVSGLPDTSGDFSGWYDDATAQAYAAAQDGQPRKFYLYPNITNIGQYWFGTVIADFKAAGGVAEAISTSSTWNAASTFTKVG